MCIYSISIKGCFVTLYKGVLSDLPTLIYTWTDLYYVYNIFSPERNPAEQETPYFPIISPTYQNACSCVIKQPCLLLLLVNNSLVSEEVKQDLFDCVHTRSRQGGCQTLACHSSSLLGRLPFTSAHRLLCSRLLTLRLASALRHGKKLGN